MYLRSWESIVQFPPNPESSYSLVRTILFINEIAKFLEEPEFSLPKSSMKLRDFFFLCEHRFFELIFLIWSDGTRRSLLPVILDSPAAYDLIADSLSAHIGPKHKSLTHGHLGRTTMLLEDALLSMQSYWRMHYFPASNSTWTMTLSGKNFF